MTKIYEVELESISPMLHHSSQAIGTDEKMKKKGGSALMGDEDEWRKTIYFDEQEGVYLPAVCVEAALIEGAKQFKITGRATATKFFKSGVFIETNFLPFYVGGKIIKDLDEALKNKTFFIDKRSVKNPSTKGRNMRYRACFTSWKSKFNIRITADDYITKDLLKEVFDYAGNYVGVGDYRPRFGRFHTISIKEVA